MFTILADFDHAEHAYNAAFVGYLFAIRGHDGPEHIKRAKENWEEARDGLELAARRILEAARKEG